MGLGRTVNQMLRPAGLYLSRIPLPSVHQDSLHDADTSVPSSLLDAKTFDDVQTLNELNRVNHAQKAGFDALVESSGGALVEQRCSAYLIRWREALVHIGSDSKVLDIGGGWPIDRVWEEAISKHHLKYHLLDIDHALVADAKARLPLYGLPSENAMVGINTVLPFDDESFDAVFSSHCLEHSPQLDRTFGEIFRVLRPEGKLVFAVPFGFDDSDEHLICLDIDGWIESTELAGFSVVNYHIGATYPMSGWDLLVVATRKPEGQNMSALRALVGRFTKAGRTFVKPANAAFRYEGKVVISDPHRVLSGTGSRSVLKHSRGVDAVLFLRQPSSGVVEIVAGPHRLVCDLYNRAPYVQAVALPTASPVVEVRVIGKSRGLEQAVLHGALLAL